MRAAVTAVCAFTVVASCWLFVMFLVLRHPGYEWRAVLSLGFAAIGALTIAATRRAALDGAFTAALAAGAIAIGATGAWAITTNVDEGFVDLIGLAFIVQAVMTLAYLWRERPARVARRLS